MPKTITAYMLWNWREERPAISSHAFGTMYVYLSIEQARACLLSMNRVNQETSDKSSLEVREIKIETHD